MDKVLEPLADCPGGLRRLQRKVSVPREGQRIEEAPGTSSSCRGQVRAFSLDSISNRCLLCGQLPIPRLRSGIRYCAYFKVNSLATWQPHLYPT